MNYYAKYTLSLFIVDLIITYLGYIYRSFKSILSITINNELHIFFKYIKMFNL